MVCYAGYEGTGVGMALGVAFLAREQTVHGDSLFPPARQTGGFLFVADTVGLLRFAIFQFILNDL